MIIRNVLFVILFLFQGADLLATTYYTTASNNVFSPIWSDVSTTGTGYVFSSLTPLANGDEIYIDDDISFTALFQDWKNYDITIYLNSTMTFQGGKLELSAGSKIIFQSSSAKLVSIGPGNSDKISIGPGPAQWDGNDPDLTGPGTLDINSNGALPIELLYFKASKGIGGVSLSWATASELNFDYFDIEKSADGNDFQSIGSVTGHGTTNERHDYALADEKPCIGKNYYRLKSVDLDGSAEYFRVVLVDFDGSKEFAVYPNPSDGITMNIQTNFFPQTRAFVVVYNTSGAEMARFEVFGNKSVLDIPVPLAAGVYYAKYISGDFTATHRLVVE